MYFRRVSTSQFVKDLMNKYLMSQEKALRVAAEPVPLPVRATAGSAGYDFFSPVETIIRPGESVTIPTGIKVKLDPGQVLFILPRSSLGMKYRMQLDNSVGVIDSDYFDNQNNEGHILIRVTNASYQERELHITQGMRFAHGIVLNYAIAEDDAPAEQERKGGMGSTGK